MRIVKKFQLVLDEESIRVFDRLFDIAEEDDPDERKILAGDFFVYVLNVDLSTDDMLKLVMAAVQITAEVEKDYRFTIVQELIKTFANGEIERFLYNNKGSGSENEIAFEYLTEDD